MPSAERNRVSSSSSPGSSLMTRISFNREPLRTTEVLGSFGQACSGGSPTFTSSGAMTAPSRSPSETTRRSPFFGRSLLPGRSSCAAANLPPVRNAPAASVVKRSERRVCFGHRICRPQLRYEPGSQSRVTSALDGKGNKPRVRKARLRSVVLHLQKAQRGFSPLPVAPVEVPVAEPVVGGAESVFPGGGRKHQAFPARRHTPTHRTGESWRPCQAPPAFVGSVPAAAAPALAA
jgi:hypothetical protein